MGTWLSTDDSESLIPRRLPAGCLQSGTYVTYDEVAAGDCLFEALARQLPQGLNGRCGAVGVRAEICDWLVLNILPLALDDNCSFQGHWQGDAPSSLVWAHRQLFLQSYPELGSSRARTHDYISQMRVPGSWGSGLEALAAAYLSMRPMWIWREHVHGQPEVLQPPLAGTEAAPIGLLHVNGNHWQSIVITLEQQLQAQNSGDPAVLNGNAREEEIGEPSTYHGGHWLTDAERDLRRQRNLARHQNASTGQAMERIHAPARVSATFSRGSELKAVLPRPKTKVTRPRLDHQVQEQREEAGDMQLPSHGPIRTNVDCLEKACAALMRIGLSREEAACAVQTHQDNLQMLKTLYCIDWDDQRTVQTVFDVT